MSSPVVTPNMSLTEPGIGNTLSPAWAMLLNANFQTIDQHDHTSGQGVQIPPGGLNINSDLTFQGNNLTNLNSLIYNGTVTGTPAVLSMYTNGTDLFYKDSNGNPIQLTKSGGPNAGTGNIQGLPSTPIGGAGISWVNSSSTFKMLADDGTSGANVDSATLVLRYPGSYPTPAGNFVALQAPSSFTGGGYALTMPAGLPSGNNALISTATSGVQTFLPGGTVAQELRISGSALAWVNSSHDESSTSSSFTTTSTSFVDMGPNNMVTVTLTGRPVLVQLQSDQTSNISFLSTHLASGSGGTAVVAIYAGGTPIATYEIGNISGGNTVFVPPSAVSCIDTTSSPGSVTYTAVVKVGSGLTTFTAENVQIIAVEL